jgi:hypothetical protein
LDCALPSDGDPEAGFLTGADELDTFELSSGGVLLPPPPMLGGFGLTMVPEMDPGRKLLGDIFGDTTDTPEGGNLGDTVVCGYLGETVGPRIPDPEVCPYPPGLADAAPDTERLGDVSSDLDSLGIWKVVLSFCPASIRFTSSARSRSRSRSLSWRELFCDDEPCFDDDDGLLELKASFAS